MPHGGARRAERNAIALPRAEHLAAYGPVVWCVALLTMQAQVDLEGIRGLELGGHQRLEAVMDQAGFAYPRRGMSARR